MNYSRAEVWIGERCGAMQKLIMITSQHCAPRIPQSDIRPCHHTPVNICSGLDDDRIQHLFLYYLHSTQCNISSTLSGSTTHVAYLEPPGMTDDPTPYVSSAHKVGIVCYANTTRDADEA